MRCLLPLVLPSVALCLPVLRHGEAQIQTSGKSLTVTAADRAILEWKEFSIGEGEITRFILPNATSAVLNRVTEGLPSHLLGYLESNGTVFLINPNGIIIGKDAKISAAAFIASTLDVLDRAFLEKEELEFFGDSSARVVNLGTISCPEGEIFLIDRSGEGRETILKPKNSSHIFIRTEQETQIDNFYASAFFPHVEPDALIISKGAVLSANALKKGDGGKITIISEGSTAHFGAASAQGGPEGGNGGFIEVSGAHLVFEGTANTLAPLGERGTLCLDPIDLAITAANLNVTGASPFTPTASPSTLSNAALQAALIGNNVIVTTVGTPTAGNGDITFTNALVIPAGSGDLTVNAARNIVINNAITNNSAATSIALTAGLTTPGSITNAVAGTINFPIVGSTGNLTLTANNGINLSGVIGPLQTSGATLIHDTSLTGITITANIQNAVNGDVTLQEDLAGPVNIGQAAINRDVSIGSANGISRITALNSTVTLQARQGGGLRVSQLGYLTPDGGTASGNIFVDCDTLTLNGGGGNSAAQIGHGNAHGNVNTNCRTVAPANITINVENTITIDGSNTSPTTDAQALIGHGSGIFDSNNANLCDQVGDITVISRNGDINLGHSSATAARCYSRIGHGSLTFTAGGANFPNITGAITVQAPNLNANPLFGNINLLSTASVNNNFVHIGHGGARSFGATLINNDVDISCWGNLTLSGLTPGISNQTVAIGCLYSLAIPVIVENIRVAAGNTISLTARQRASIGTIVRALAGSISYSGEITVVAGTDVILTTQDDAVFIGADLQPGVPMVLNNNVFVAAGRDVNIDLSATPLISAVASIAGGGDVAVAAGRNVLVTANLVGSIAQIGTTHRNGGNASTTIRAGGDILANNATAGQAYLGYNFVDFNAAPYSVEIRAGGDIQMARSLVNTDSGSIFVEADTCLFEGDLWGYTGTDLTSIAGFNLNFPLTQTGQFPPDIDISSPELLADGFGGFRIVTTPAIATNHISFPSVSGDITVHSAPLRSDGITLQNLTVDTAAPNSLNISTTSGDIDIGGSLCRCPDGFNDVNINTVVQPWTSGSIYGRATHDFTVNTAIETGGLNSPITLIADCDNSGGGALVLNADVITDDGALFLSAGNIGANCQPGFPCASGIAVSTSVITQNAGAITCGVNGNCTLVSAGNITISSVTADSGFIHMLAGNNIAVSGTVQNASPAGDILLIAGNNISMTAGTIFSPNPVTLVVDNNNPAPPNIGAGAFFMDAASSITGNTILVFTALQNQNSILGQLNTASFPNPPGTLFADYELEQWCSYFECTSPYTNRANLGLPFTVFYKDCAEVIIPPGTTVVSEMLFSLQPIYLEWPEEFSNLWRFLILYDKRDSTLRLSPDEYYWLQRKRLRGVHTPFVHRLRR